MLISTKSKPRRFNIKLTHRLAQKLCIPFAFLTVCAAADTGSQGIQPSDESQDTNTIQQTNTDAPSTTTTDNQPTSYDALKKLVDEGKKEKAITLARDSLTKEENTDTRTLLGYLLLQTGDYTGAKQQFEIALKNSSNGYPDVSDGLALIEIHNNNYKAALNIINDALQLDPTSKLLLDRRKQILSYLNSKNKTTASQTTPKQTTATDQTTQTTTQTKDKKKLNAITVGYQHSSVSDLDEIWQWGSVGYKRVTPFGPIIARLNRAYRFGEYGTQYELEAYPHILDNFYLYLNYGYSGASFLANHQYNYEGFFSLPHAYEFSVGERLLQFQSSTTQVYTGSLGKYIGNYWIAYRPYITKGVSNSLTIRRYFSSPESYISLTGSYGSGPGDITDPNDVSANRSESISLGGQFPIKENILLCNWSIGNSLEHFPTGKNRSETDLGVGFTWQF